MRLFSLRCRSTQEKCAPCAHVVDGVLLVVLPEILDLKRRQTVDRILEVLILEPANKSIPAIDVKHRSRSYFPCKCDIWFYFGQCASHSIVCVTHQARGVSVHKQNTRGTASVRINKARVDLGQKPAKHIFPEEKRILNPTHPKY